MKSDSSTAIWACAISANAWFASSNQPLGFAWGFCWLVFAALIALAPGSQE